MKKQIRYKTFETNSSNMNSLTVMTKTEYEELMRKWNSDDWLWDCWEEKWVLASSIDRENDSEWRYWDDPTDEHYDVETAEYTSPSGDELIALSIYGNDNY